MNTQSPYRVSGTNRNHLLILVLPTRNLTSELILLFLVSLHVSA
jgi:hypothetical protein